MMTNVTQLAIFQSNLEMPVNKILGADDHGSVHCRLRYMVAPDVDEAFEQDTQRRRQFEVVRRQPMLDSSI